MRSASTLLIVLVLTGLTVGCSSAPPLTKVVLQTDELARTLVTASPELASIVASGGDDAARNARVTKALLGIRNNVDIAIPAVIDDPARVTAKNRIAVLNLTPDQKTRLENTVISTACFIVVEILKDGELSNEELLSHIVSQVPGLDDDANDWIIDSAQLVIQGLSGRGYDQRSLTDYCDQLS